MKSSVLVASSVFALLLATPSLAQESGNYIQGNLGAVLRGKSDLDVTFYGDDSGKGDLDLDLGMFVSGTFGHKLSSKWAVEGEVVYSSTDVDAGELEDVLEYLADERVNLDVKAKTYGVLVNANYEFVRSAKVGMYAGAGVGFGRIEYKLTVPSEDLAGSAKDNGFMWQLKAGLTYDFTPSTTLDLGYRYLASPRGKGGVDDELTLSVDTSSHILSAGVRYSF